MMTQEQKDRLLGKSSGGASVTAAAVEDKKVTPPTPPAPITPVEQKPDAWQEYLDSKYPVTEKSTTGTVSISDMRKQMAPKVEVEKPKGFMTSIWEDVKKRGSNIWEDVKEMPSGEEGMTAENFNETARGGLHIAGEIAGGVNDIIGAAISNRAKSIWNILPQGQKDILISSAKFLGETETVQKGMEAIADGLESYDGWKKENPELAEDLESVVNITSLLPSTKATKVGLEGVEAGVKKAVEEGAEFAATTAKKGAEAIGESITETAMKEALDITKPVLSKVEKEAAIASGRSKSSITKGVEITPSSRDLEVADSVAGIVKKSNKVEDNITAVKEVIKETADAARKEIVTYNEIVDTKDIVSVIDKAKDASKVIFGSDKTLESAYDAIRDEFMRTLSKYPKTLEGLWDARIAFDDIINSKFPKLLSGEAGDKVRNNAVRDIRKAINDYVADTLPVGNTFKESLRKMTHMYDAVDNMAAQGAKNVDRGILKRAADAITRNPVVSSLSIAGVGLGGATLAGIISSPLALAGLVTYGTYKLGKKVVTSSQVKNGLKKTLEMIEKGTMKASPEEKQAIESIMLQLPEKATSLRAPKESVIEIAQPATSKLYSQKEAQDMLKKSAGEQAPMIRDPKTGQMKRNPLYYGKEQLPKGKAVTETAGTKAVTGKPFEQKLWNGSNKVTKESEIKLDNPLVVDTDQRELLKKWGTSVKNLFTDGDPIIKKRLMEEGYDGVIYLNKGELELKGMEVHNFKDNKFYSDSKEYAELYAMQSRGAKHDLK